MGAENNGRVPVPRDRDDDYTRDAAAARRAFAEEKTGATLEHVSSYSFDPDVLRRALGIAVEQSRHFRGEQHHRAACGRFADGADQPLRVGGRVYARCRLEERDPNHQAAFSNCSSLPSRSSA